MTPLKTLLGSTAIARAPIILTTNYDPGASEGTISISRTCGTAQSEIVAPFGCWLKASLVSGFDESEVADDTQNVYDPAQHNVTFVWTLPDESYSPTLTPNIPNAWRTFTTDYGKHIAAVFTTPGDKTVHCFAYDRSGNWATKTYSFNDVDGDDPAIRDPDVHFSEAETIIVDATGAFTDAPPGHQVTTLSSAQSRVISQYGTGLRKFRVRFRFGDTYTDQQFSPNPGSFGNFYGIYIDAWGASENGRPIFQQNTVNGPFGFNDNAGLYCVLKDADMRGDWDASTETGRAMSGTTGTGDAWYKDFSDTPVLVMRSRWDGFNNIGILEGTPDGSNRILFDTELTNWKDFGFYPASAESLAFIWCDFHQHEDALQGCNTDEAGNSNNWKLGNLHGPYRGASTRRHVSRTSMFNRAGWSNASDRSFVDFPPTAAQPCMRTQGDLPNGLSSINCTMSTFEGPEDILRHQFFLDTPYDENPASVARNFIYDRNLICGTGMTTSFMNMNYPGFTIRNNYFVLPDSPWARSGTGTRLTTIVQFGVDDWDAPDTSVPDQIYNNTAVYLGASLVIANDGSDPSIAWFNQQAWRGPVTSQNNLLHAPNLTTPITTYSPIGSTALAGFVPRWKGNLWNFPPIGVNAANTLPEYTVGDGRFNETGASGDCAPGEWIAIPYPDYSGKCKGAGDVFGGGTGQVTQADVLANSTQKHVISISGVEPKNMGDDALYANADGNVVFDFTATEIRIQNATASTTWAAAERIAILLDLSDYLMGFVAGTANPATVPAPIPGTGSAAIEGATSGLASGVDFLGEIGPDHPDYAGARAHPVVGAFNPATA